MRQLPPFTRKSGLLPARGKHKQYALGDRTVRFASALIWIVAALLIACSSDSTLPAPQVGNETSTDARPSVAATELPTAMPTAETTADQSIPPATIEPATPPTGTEAPEAQPETETVPTAKPQEPTATAPTTATSRPDLPSPTPPSTALPALPTATATGAATVLRVTVSAVPATLPDYDRNDWKQWTDADRDCQDARNEVLIAESQTRVAYRTDRKCRVAAGEWLAPYTNTIVTDPSRLDVDHMVPLSNAHDSGAWQWSANRREQYANYLEDPQHLIAVTASANRSKGARGPDQWKPEDRTYWCQYAVDWITIKSTWELTVIQQEHSALAQMLNTCAKRPELMVSHQSQVKPTPGPTSNPVQQTPTSEMRTYNSCDAAQAAGATRIQGSKGNGRGFPKWMVPSARDGDGDGVVCEN